MNITERGSRACEQRLIVLSDPTWSRSVAVRMYIVRRNGDIDNWEAYGELLDGTGEPRPFAVFAQDLDEDVEPEDNDAIALAVSRWCLTEFAGFFLTLVDGGEEVVRPVSWTRVLSPKV
jgi:hypothetical protein